MTFISYLAILCASIGLFALMRRDALSQSSAQEYYVDPQNALAGSHQSGENAKE